MKKFLSSAFIAVFLCLSLTGCETFDGLADYVRENPVFASVATRQAVGRYIAAGETPEVEAKRAADVQKRITKVLSYLDGEPNVSVDTLLTVIDASIDWDELTPPDRMLVTDLITLVEAELRKFELQTPTLTTNTRLALRGLFETAIRTANFYLVK